MGKTTHVVHHNVHPGQLTPDLRKDPNVQPSQHLRLEQLPKAHICIPFLKINHLPNFAQFKQHKRCIRIALSMDQGKHVMAFFPFVVAREPARRLGKQHDSKEQEHRGEHLQAPGDAPSGGAGEIGAAVGDVEHDEDAPCDGPLLCANDSSALTRRRQLAHVHRDLGRADTDGEAVDEAAYDQHADALRCAYDDGTDAPDDTADLDSCLATEFVGEEAGTEGANEGAAGHGCCDAALDVGTWAGAIGVSVEIGAVGALIEVAAVLFGGETVFC